MAAIEITAPSRDIGYKLFGVLLGAAVSAASIAGLYLELSSLPHRALAAQLEEGAMPDWAFFKAFDENRDASRFAQTCFHGLARDASVIWLSALDAAQQTADPKNSDFALEKASESLRARLACSPLDGAAWLRLAVVEMQRTGPNPEISAMLGASYWTTPNEMQVVQARVRFASRLYQAGVDGIFSVLEQDIRTMSAWGDVETFRTLRAEAPPKVADLYATALALLPSGRRDQLSRVP